MNNIKEGLFIKIDDSVNSTDKIIDINSINKSIKENNKCKCKCDVTKKNTQLITYIFYKECIEPNHINSKKKRNTNKTFIYKEQIKNTLDYLKIEYNKNSKKKILETQLFSFYKSISEKDNTKDIIKINKIKNYWKKYLNNKRLSIYGPGFLSKSSCINQEDCFTMEDINDIPDKFFFSIKDKKNCIFFFDVRTFNKLMSKKKINPYTREPIDDISILKFNKRKEYMKQNNIDIIFPEELEYIKNLSPEQKIQNKIFSIFQTIDELNVMAGGTKLSWFNNLNVSQLKKYYRVLEDVWNYRASLSLSQKKEIVPENNMFSFGVNYILQLNNTVKLKNIILNEMDKLINSAPNVANRHTGAYYVLIALTEVSPECANDMPWLIQY